ncbi:hypothetical protein QCM77_44240 [Bradyrhizobium sp. SSUT18]|uniref:hypothetical protein n=1 Tax=Bradyrhizobium sp. SSUT18 TaxID=3040602 RepID=UPI002448F31F|nr:hypothetical protein [Bradyrhizobium sp. SSUT18]MDH2406795.1 hypothetical protein [Bradyrhizobium sp. SSUT18]
MLREIVFATASKLSSHGIPIPPLDFDEAGRTTKVSTEIPTSEAGALYGLLSQASVVAGIGLCAETMCEQRIPYGAKIARYQRLSRQINVRQRWTELRALLHRRRTRKAVFQLAAPILGGVLPQPKISLPEKHP